MKNHALLPLVMIPMLLACNNGASSSSSSSSSASSSSSSSSVPACRRLNLLGDFQVDVQAVVESAQFDISLDLHGVELKVTSDTPLERLGDALDYTYYSVSNLIGTLSAEAIRLTAQQDRTTLIYDFETTTIDFFLLEGTFYVDLSSLSVSEASQSSSSSSSSESQLPTGKIFIKDAVSFLNDEQYRTLADILSLGVFGMDTLLKFAQQDQTIGNALSMERYNDEEFFAKYALNSDSVAALVNQFSESSGAETKKAIDDAITFGQDTYVSALFNAKTQTVSELGLHGEISPNLSTASQEVQNAIKTFTLSVDGKGFIDGTDEFTIPPLDDYQEYVPPTSQEEPA